MITGSEILYSCKSLVVIHMATMWFQSGITASVDSAKSGSVLTAVQMLGFYCITGLLQPAQKSV